MFGKSHKKKVREHCNVLELKYSSLIGRTASPANAWPALGKIPIRSSAEGPAICILISSLGDPVVGSSLSHYFKIIQKDIVLAQKLPGSKVSIFFSTSP